MIAVYIAADIAKGYVLYKQLTKSSGGSTTGGGSDATVGTGGHSGFNWRPISCSGPGC